MNVANKLQYGDRFGDQVIKLANSKLSVATSSSDAEVATARYSKWFHDNDGQTEPMATSSRKFRKITPYMAAAEVAAATLENLTILGNDAGDIFTPRLPVEHKMRKAIRSSIMPGVPYPGTCKFGEIVTDRGHDKYGVAQIFIANFDGDLDTRCANSYLKPKGRDFDQMIYGVHLIVDRFGKPLGINRSRGSEGVAFKTKDLTEALYQIASVSSGLSKGELHQRLGAVRKG